MSERLHKVLAQHGVGSRREVERWISEGRIQINGVTAKTGDRYELGDRVQLDGREVGKRLERVTNAQVIVYHKPQGQPIERRPTDRQSADHAPEIVEESVEERLPVHRGSRWVAINPMHPGDSGLLLFTNDGALAYALTRQKKKIPTTYMVRVHVRGGAAAAPALPTTLRLDNQTIDFTEVTVSSNALDGESESGNVWYKVVMPRADKRAAVRALFVSHGLTVSRMMQVAFGEVALTKEMPRARSVALKPAQMDSLYNLAQLTAPTVAVREAASPRRGRTYATKAHFDHHSEASALTIKDLHQAGRARALVKPDDREVRSNRPVRGSQQRAELRRAKGGGSNRPSRPGSIRSKK
jgi:23S rRNA pseudouridine2605 synthase